MTAVTTRSGSGQFIVRGYPQPSRLPPLLLDSPVTNWVRLEPKTLALSCERIKEALLSELGAPDRWRSKVIVSLHPVRAAEETPRVAATWFTDGWVYYVETPDAVDPVRFVRTIVHVLLAEWANRASSGHAAEVPAWLREGLTEQVLSDATLELIVSPAEFKATGIATRTLNRQGRRLNPLARAHEYLRTHSPLTLQDLSWPQPEQYSGDKVLSYRFSAQLFVFQLLRVRGGRPAMGMMLDTLARNLNWQTAFFNAYGGHFRRMLDLEKWWELEVVAFTGRELSHLWGGADSLAKLAEALRAPVQFRASTNQPAVHATASLQAVMLEGDYAQKRELLRFKIQQLQSLPLRVAPEVVPLVRDYQRVLEAYVGRMENSQTKSGKSSMSRIDSRRLAEDTAKQLDALDARRATWLEQPVAPPPTTPPPKPANTPVKRGA